jgi:hypothetical protein
VAAVDEEIVGQGALRRGDAHGDDGAPVDAPCSRGVPWPARVGENVLFQALLGLSWSR